MANFLLIPGADGHAWYWHRLVPLLADLGHTAHPVELPKAGTANLSDYRDAAVAAADVRTPSVVVGHSLGAFTAPLVCELIPTRMIVLTNPMVPRPGETGNDWWDNTRQSQARVEAARQDGRPTEFDLVSGFFHDVP